ncbi:MAG: cysteine hydrolase [Methanoregulaceae archaeon]|jgi:nicotinamidase-related amidase|nr:cysteine hydrolase [Methanoregulaceae archaeon]
MKQPALLIIDMQNDFVRAGAPMQMPGAERIIKNIRKVMEVFRNLGYPVFHVVRVHRSDGSDVEIFRREMFKSVPFAVEGTGGVEIIEELRPLQGEYLIRKNRMSAFMNTDLDLLLRSLGIYTVFITGIQTPNCIRTTVFDAAALGYHTVLVEDAVAARTSAVHEANLLDMANIGTVLISTDSTADLVRG